MALFRAAIERDSVSLLKFPSLADGFSLEFEWQQISSGLQDSSQNFYSSQQYRSLEWSPFFF